LITLNLKWFVGLSVAAHAAVLVGWQSPLIRPGHTGHAVQLSIVQQAGDEPARAATTAVTPRPQQEPAVPTATDRPVREASPATPAIARQAAPVFQTLVEPVKQEVTEPVAMSATPATATSSPVAQPHEVDRYLRDSVMKLITQELTYPAIARRKGWQGVVKVELHIEADGSITGLQLDETSGYAVLDRAALQCLQTANIPDATQWLRGRSADIIVPVEYRLVDS
jgi:protein TonB